MGPAKRICSVKAKESLTALTGPQQDSFEALYRQHWAPLARLAWLLTGSREVGEDVVHDAFIKIVPFWSSLDVPDQYLRRIVVNESLDHRRKKVIARHQLFSRQAGVESRGRRDLGGGCGLAGPVGARISSGQVTPPSCTRG